MDVAGQGKIPDKIKPKSPTDNNAQKPKKSINLITFQPLFAWKIKTLPPKIPDSGAHGGSLLTNHDLDKNKNNNNNNNNQNSDGSDNKNSKTFQTIYIKDVGQGAGYIIPQSSGPVLIGTISLSPHSDLALWIIAGVLLFILAIVWMITHFIYPVRRHRKHLVKYFTSRRFVKSSENDWVDGYEKNIKSHSSTIDQLSLIQSKTEFQNSQTVKSVSGSANQMKPFFTSPLIHKDYAQSLQISTHGSVRQNGLRSQSSASLWSYQTIISDNISLMHGSFSGPLMYSQIIESQGIGLIFTISELRCPNTWLRKDFSSVSHCENSSFEECLEIFLLYRETLLIGKMKNVRHKRNEGDFVIQIWKTFDGSLEKSVPDELDSFVVNCDAVCTAHDEFLVLIRQGEVFVWNIVLNRIISKIKLPNIQTWKGRHSIQATPDMQNIIIMIFLPLSGTTHLYSYNFDILIRGLSSFQYRSFQSQNTLYSLISNSSILIAGSTNAEITIWNFFNNTDMLLNIDNGEKILRLLNSSSGDLMLLQSNSRLSIWKTDQWNQLSDIYIPSTKVCSLKFSQNMGDICLLAAALENGSIHIYNTVNGELIRILQISVPIVYMLFGNDHSSLLVMTDRASHYKLFMFDIQY